MQSSPRRLAVAWRALGTINRTSVPIHVDLDGECLYGYATLGQKIVWMRENPLVCLEVDELTAHGQWASVVVFGRYEELPPTPEFEGSRDRLPSVSFRGTPCGGSPPRCR